MRISARNGISTTTFWSVLLVATTVLVCPCRPNNLLLVSSLQVGGGRIVGPHNSIGAVRKEDDCVSRWSRWLPRHYQLRPRTVVDRPQTNARGTATTTTSIIRRKYRNFDYDDDDYETTDHDDERRKKNLPKNDIDKNNNRNNLRLASRIVRGLRLRGRTKKRFFFFDETRILHDLYGVYHGPPPPPSSSSSASIVPAARPAAAPSDVLDTEPPPRRNMSQTKEENKKKKKKTKRQQTTTTSTSICTVEELRSAVLDGGVDFRNIDLKRTDCPIPTTFTSSADAAAIIAAAANATIEGLSSHAVLDLIASRFESGSKPSHRAPSDSARLALSIEGGGMRGAVGAGMAAAIASLGLCDAFDTIYGSSAGSVVGAYLVSRQMCVDVYTDVLPAAKGTFVSKGRIVAGLAKNLAHVVLLSGRNTGMGHRQEKVVPMLSGKNPGMNISFVLDGIMCPQAGLRPLDLEAFRTNDAHQPLRIVASTVRKDRMETICFGSREKDFFDVVDDGGNITDFATTSADGRRHGLFACLEASMSVPGAAGPPIKLIRSKDSEANTVSSCFDAFCYEPLPYRSAVEEGATHVLVLRSRPDGFPLQTKPGAYERAMAPLYFRANGQHQVAEYFKMGGQNYVYAEDILTLDEARLSTDGVRVPPPHILHGAPEEQRLLSQRLYDRASWKRAHLLPVIMPRETPELASLEQGEDEVLHAVRAGFAAAYDLLAPAVGLEIEGLAGKRAAELVFPKLSSPDTVLKVPREVRGEPIARHDVGTVETEGIEKRKKRFRRWLKRDEASTTGEQSSSLDDTNAQQYNSQHVNGEPCPRRDARRLLAFLPGIQSGALAPLTEGLLHHKHGNGTFL